MVVVMCHISLLINSTLLIRIISHISVLINHLMSTAMSHISLVINSITLMITIITRISVTVNYSMLVTISHISLFINSITLMRTTTIPYISVSINSIPSTVKIFHFSLSMMYRIGRTKINCGSIEEQNLLVAIRQEFSRTLFLSSI